MCKIAVRRVITIPSDNAQTMHRQTMPSVINLEAFWSCVDWVVVYSSASDEFNKIIDHCTQGKYQPGHCESGHWPG